MPQKAAVLKTLDLVKSGNAKIGIIGLGYVGLPLALAFAKKYQVIGYEVDEARRSKLQRGISYLDDIPDSSIKRAVGRSLKVANDTSELAQCDVLVICVPTPLDARGNPDLSYVADSARIVERVLHKGMLVVLESTSYPGTTEEYLGRAIQNAGCRLGDDVALAFSPERVDPGNKKFNISNTPKIVGGIDAVSADVAAALYSSIVAAGVVRVSDCKTAEASKIVENIFRGVNIALINELSLIFDKMGIDTWEVVRAASTKPFAFMPHFPGPGVGGHCIPLDPLYLSYKAKQYGLVPRFVELSREVNEFMKHHTVNLTLSALSDANVRFEDATVGVLGVAYKKNISDARESPAIDVIEELSKRVGRVVAHDPRIKTIATPSCELETIPLSELIRSSDCIVFVTDHDEYRMLNAKDLRNGRMKAIVDTRNIFNGDEITSMGLIYKAIGKPNIARSSQM